MQKIRNHVILGYSFIPRWTLRVHSDTHSENPANILPVIIRISLLLLFRKKAGRLSKVYF
jgi:hypothetical protein